MNPLLSFTEKTASGHWTLVHRDSQLTQHQIAEVVVRNRLRCGQACSVESACASFNFQWIERGTKALCQLNDKLVSENPTDLVAKPGFFYYERDY